MENKISLLIGEANALIGSAGTSAAVNDLRIKYLGKNGELTALLKGMKDVSANKRPQMGKLMNDARTQIENLLEKREKQIASLEKQHKIESEKIDITLPAKKQALGTLHPLNIVKNQIVDAFSSLGFELCDGPEIELDYYSFQALNIPKDHPARDMQDTFYINENVLLRPHTSPAQVHVMETQKPPIRILSHGKVYRSDDDATHSPMFHQIEGLVVEKNVTLCDLKGVLDEFARQMFTKETKTRLRPSHFPFTEPSVEVDVSCAMCGGSGCRLCKGTGWLEVLGAGMVNPKVLENCGIDSNVYKGFAFGIGIERITMLKYGLPDMRLLFENDVRFLKQFKQGR